MGMTNKEFILKISDDTRKARIGKILSLCVRPYKVQSGRGWDNIVIPAKEQKNKISVIAHHDVYPGSRGYNDNSTGVVTLLKLQRYVPDDVELVFTDGEEIGGAGCAGYLFRGPRPRMAINVDVVGLGPKVFYEKYADDGRIEINVPEMEPFNNIPFSDSHVLEMFGVPNVIVLTGASPKRLLGDISRAQHCGKNDGDLDIISEETMDNVFDNLLTIIGRNSRAKKRRS
jgi:hypothetical protein